MIDIICILFFVLITICLSIGCYKSKSKYSYNTKPIEDTIIYTEETDNVSHNIKLRQEKINEADINTGDSLTFKM